jgi:uncharacterized protein (DUF2267 family)
MRRRNDFYNAPDVNDLPYSRLHDYEHEPDRNSDGNRRTSSAHLEKYAEDGNRFIHEVAEELCIDDHHQALRITKAVLHAIRDRLPVAEAVEFSQGLPLMLKAIYFDQYDLSQAEMKIRTKARFLEFVRDKDGLSAPADFRNPQDVVICVQSVCAVLERWMDRGQMEQLKELFPLEIRSVLDGAYIDML